MKMTAWRHSRKAALAGVVLSALTAAAHADEQAADARIAELEKKMLQMAQEMQAMQTALAEAKQASVEEKGKSKGQPVYAVFKDGIKFEDASGDWQLAINGRVQADYRAFDPDEAAADTWSVRRARLGATMTFYKDFVARVEGEYSGSNTQLTYAYFDINTFKPAKIRLGQFKPFYGLERSTSTNFTDFQERSTADALLGGTYDRGVMVHGSPLKGMYYSAAYINGGSGDDTNAEYDNKDVMARVTGNLAEVADWKDAVVHVGGFYAEGEQAPGSSVPSMRTEARGYTYFTATPSTFADKIDRNRGGVELAVAKGPVKFQSEYLRTEFDADGADRDLSAWYASLNWIVSGESFASGYKNGAFGRLHPRNNFKLGGSGWGALQVGIRYSSFDGSDFKDMLAANKTDEADAWTLGANWVLNPNVRLVANYVHTRFDNNVTSSGETFDDEDALTMRAQFDF